MQKTEQHIIKGQEWTQKEYNGNAIGIDLGLSNLATCITTNGDSFIVNGKPLKAINQFYNKRKAKLQSELTNKTHSSKRIERLSFRRNNKVKNYLHPIWRAVVAPCRINIFEQNIQQC